MLQRMFFTTFPIKQTIFYVKNDNAAKCYFIFRYEDYSKSSVMNGFPCARTLYA